MQEIIFEERYFYQFYKEKDNYYLSVLCGTVAQFDITIKFTETEIETYLLKGKNYIVIKANEIFNDPEKFVSRKI
jgi:fructose-specific component phosphotransferase system IIB-like protein